MPISHIGRKAPSTTSYILSLPQKGKPDKIVLDENRNLREDKSEEQLVLYRQQEDQSWAWETIKSVEELKTFFASASPEEKSNHLGTWKDSKRFFFVPGDGVVQTQEVTPMKERWDALSLSKVEREYDREHGQNCATIRFYSEVVPKRVRLKEKQLATGKALVLEESRRYVEAEAERVTQWRMTSSGWRAAEVETVLYDAASRKDFS